MAEHNEIGKKGEEIATSFLMKQGFVILERNFKTKEGELDIVAKKDTILHCIEAKTVKVTDCSSVEQLRIRPEDNLTIQKYRKIITTFEIFKKLRNVPHETKQQIDLACVYIDTEKRQARVKLIQNIHMK